MKYGENGYYQSIPYYQSPFNSEFSNCGKKEEFDAADVHVKCLEPLRRWRIAYNGLLRKVQPNESPESQEDIHVRFLLIWAVTSSPFDFKTDMSPDLTSEAVSQSFWKFLTRDKISDNFDRYEQWGQLKGIISVDDQDDEEFILWGMKARHFGIEDWTQCDRYLRIYGYMEDGMMLNVSLLPIPGLSTHIHCGYIVLPNREICPLQDCDLSLPSSVKFSQQWVVNCCAGGKRYQIKVKLGNESLKEFNGSQWEYCQFLRSAELLLDGQTGQGIVQLGQRCYSEQENFFVIDLSDKVCQNVSVAGGKGTSVACLTQLGKNCSKFQVPKGFILSTAAYNRHLANHPILSQCIDDIRKAISSQDNEILRKACASAVTEFLNTDIAQDLKDEITKVSERTFRRRLNELYLAVRSSDVCEDSSETSAAGQMKTILGVKGPEKIWSSIIQCWASSVAFNVVQYRRQNGQAIEPNMAVVIQEMVPSQVAGVMFTVHPVTGHPSFISLSASYGLGESVVSAAVEPDTITLKKTKERGVVLYEQLLGSKKMKYQISEKGGTLESVVSVSDSEKCCLSVEDIEKLGRIGMIVESAFGSARDIEWAIIEGQIYLLQARPVTREDKVTEYDLIHGLDDGVIIENEIFSIANVGEVFPGATSPITLTGILRIMTTSFMRYFHECQGSWRPFTSLLPKEIVVFNNRIMFLVEEALMRDFEESDSSLSRMWELAVFGRLIEEREQIRNLAVHRLGYMPIHVKRRTLFYVIRDSFFIEKNLRRLKKKIFNYTIPEEMKSSSWKMYNYISHIFTIISEVCLFHATCTTVSSFFNSILFGQLLDQYQNNLEELVKDVSALLYVGNDVESAEIPSRIQELATEILNSGRATMFTSVSVEEALNWLCKDRGQAGRSFKNFISTHGHRCWKEFDVMTATWEEDPRSLVQTLQNLLRTSGENSATKTNKSVDEAIQHTKYKSGTRGSFFFRRVVSLARWAVIKRENSKSILVKSVDCCRKAYRHLEKLMMKEGRLPERGLLYFFTHEEIGELLRTRSAHLIPVASKRRRIHNKLDSTVYPEIMVGPPKPITTESYLTEEINAEELRGITVCQGVVKGPARVVLQMEEARYLQEGDILITYSIDVGFSPYFPLLSGMVTEIGGLISHGAVVAREFGLPSIICVRGATAVLKSGDIVVLDATHGILKKIKDVAAE
ncbi:rifampicin phosphotransferase-like isoform X2 [Tachypleus tridentatus]